LGRHVTEALLARGHQVIAVARGHEPTHRTSRPVPLVELGAEMVRCDVLDTDTLTRAAEGVDGIFHCAGKVSREAKEAAELYRVNVGGTRSALRAARAARVRRLVLASTSGTVGMSEDENFVADEESPTPLPLIQHFPYYRSKLFAEEEALAASSSELEVLSVNPSLLLGPGDVFGSSTEDVRNFLEGAIPATPAGGLSFVDVRDAAAGMILAMEKGRPGRRYLLGAANMTVRAFFGRLARLSNRPAPLLQMPKNLQIARAAHRIFERALRAFGGTPSVDAVSVEMGQLFWYIDSTRAERELSWSARDPNETLRDTIIDLGY
ncbi:MAG: NAD-dependent epimerase/dehydratase family protein, partial [Myxococcales bacterium]|nr:NAD-dependent epimerase/dehydratase family protein [Myxococcales bacterium]